jgi:hypothetical protein
MVSSDKWAQIAIGEKKRRVVISQALLQGVRLLELPVVRRPGGLPSQGTVALSLGGGWLHNSAAGTVPLRISITPRLVDAADETTWIAPAEIQAHRQQQLEQ